MLWNEKILYYWIFWSKLYVLCSHMSTWVWLVSIEMSIKIENIQKLRILFGFCYGWDGTQTKRIVLYADKLYHRKYCEVWPVDSVAVCTCMNRNILKLPYVYCLLWVIVTLSAICIVNFVHYLLILCACACALFPHTLFSSLWWQIGFTWVRWIDIFTILFFELENIGQFYLIRENKIITRKRII